MIMVMRHQVEEVAELVPREQMEQLITQELEVMEFQIILQGHLLYIVLVEVVVQVVIQGLKVKAVQTIKVAMVVVLMADKKARVHQLEKMVLL